MTPEQAQRITDRPLTLEDRARIRWWHEISKTKLRNEYDAILAGAGDPKARAASQRVEAQWAKDKHECIKAEKQGEITSAAHTRSPADI